MAEKFEWIWRRFYLFARIVGREQDVTPEGRIVRMSAATAWAVAGIAWPSPKDQKRARMKIRRQVNRLRAGMKNESVESVPEPELFAEVTA